MSRGCEEEPGRKHRCKNRPRSEDIATGHAIADMRRDENAQRDDKKILQLRMGDLRLVVMNRLQITRQVRNENPARCADQKAHAGSRQKPDAMTPEKRAQRLTMPRVDRARVLVGLGKPSAYRETQKSYRAADHEADPPTVRVHLYRGE